MDLRTITTFNAIVEHGSFQAAAQHLNYAQSTITSHIKKIETSLGVTLFDRNQNLKLTEAGLLLKEQGLFLLKAFEALEHSLDNLIEGKSEVIRIGVMEPMASYRFPSLLQSVYDMFPDINISLHIHGSKVLADLVARDELDAAICAAASINEGLIYESILTEEVILLVHKDHPLSKLKTIDFSDIENEKLIITNTHCPVRTTLEQKMLEHKLVPKYKMEVSNMLALKHYVQAGYGMALIPLIAVSPPPEQTVIVQINHFQEGLNVGIITKDKKQYSPALTFLLQTLRSL